MKAPATGAVLPEAIITAARLRRDGRIAEALEALQDRLTEARAAPLDVPFRERVLLGLTLTDLYVAVDSRQRAQSLLANEVAFAEEILAGTMQFGSPDQIHAASAGCLQLRDRAAQIDLLGRPAPDLEAVEWLHGTPTTLVAQRGRVVVLEFWAPWCRSCTALFPYFRDLHVRYAAQGLTILALTNFRNHEGAEPPDQRARDRELIRQAIHEHAVDFAVGIAPDERLRTRYGANGIPTFAVIDRDGYVQLASSKPDKTALEGLIARLLEPGE